MNNTIYTIGYSGFPDTGSFIETLKAHDINVLIDVRSFPYSKAFSQYNKENIDALLKKNSITYRNYSSNFGARQDDPSFYADGRLDFDIFSKSDLFLDGVSKVDLILSKGYRLCFMCSEKQPANCHRAVLVTKAFHEKGHRIIHLLPDNEFKTQEDVEAELRSKLDMFDITGSVDINQLNAKAYRKQNDCIGYKRTIQ